MNGNNSNLIQFLIGIAILVAGGYAFLQNITVTSSFFSGGMTMRFGRFSAGNGAIVIPFIVGIIMLFAMPKKFVSKLVTGLGLLIIIMTIILNTHISFRPLDGYTYLIMLVGIFGGLALVLKVLLADPNKHNDSNDFFNDRSNKNK